MYSNHHATPKKWESYKIIMFQFYPHLWLIFWEDVAFVSIPLDGKHMVDNLQGHWYRQGDAKHVGRDSDGGGNPLFLFSSVHHRFVEGGLHGQL